MAQLFGGKNPGVNKEQQKAQRRQAKAIQDQTAEEAREAGSRKRIVARGRQGGSLFATTGAAGVKDKLGG